MLKFRISASQFDLLIILFLPLLLLVLNPTWIWLNSTVDTWAYHGYFLNLNEYLNYLQDSPIAYFGSRLPLLLTGSFFYHLFPNDISNYCLHLFYIYIALFSLYFLLQSLFNCSNVSLFSSVLLCCNSYFLWAMGWDYIDGPIISYSLLTFLLIALATKSNKSRLLLVLPGVSLALLIYTNLFMICFVPCFALFYFLINRSFAKHLLLKLAFYSLSGFLAITAILCFINWKINGSFLFFMPSFQFMFNNVGISSDSNIWLKLSPQSYLIYSYWLCLPILVLCLSIFYSYSLLYKRSLHDRLIFSSLLTYIVAFSVMLFWEIRAGNILTDFSSYFRFLYPQLFLAIGALSLPFLQSFQHRTIYGFIIIIVLISSSIMLLPDNWQSISDQSESLVVNVSNAIFVLSIGLIFFSLSHLYRSGSSLIRLRLYLFIASLSFVLLGIYLRYSRIYELSSISQPPDFSDLGFIFNWIIASYFPVFSSIATLLLIFALRKYLSRNFIMLLIVTNIALFYTVLDLRLSFSLESQRVDIKSPLTQSPPVGRQEQYFVFDAASQIIKNSELDIDKLIFWYQTSTVWSDFNSKELSAIYRNVASPYISSGQIINENYPSTTGVDLLGRGSALPKLAPGDIVVVLSQDTAIANLLALKSLLEPGVKPSVLSSHTISTKSYRFNLNFLRIDVDWQAVNASEGINLKRLKWNRVETSNPEVMQDQEGLFVSTNRSHFDWQVSTELISAQPNTTYLVEFDLDLMQGGMAFIVGGSPSNASSYQNQILLNEWKCSRLNSRPEKIQYLVDTKQFDAIRLVLANFGNCKTSFPKVSKYKLSHLRIAKLYGRK